jgi:hypothetical protein
MASSQFMETMGLMAPRETYVGGGGQRERRQLQKEGNQNIDSFFLYSPVLSSVHSSSNHFDRGASGSVIPLLVHQCSLDVLMGYSR